MLQNAVIAEFENHDESIIVINESEKPEKLSAKQRQELMLDLAKNLANVGAHVSGAVFQNRLQLLQTIMDGWVENVEIDSVKFHSLFLSNTSKHEEVLSNEKILLKPSFRTPSLAKHLKKCTIERKRK